MPPSILDQLSALRESLSIVLPAGQPALGDPYIVRLASGSNEPLKVLDIVTSTLSVDGLLKQVIWNNALPEDSLDPDDLGARILGGLPLELLKPLLVILGSDGGVLGGSDPSPLGDLLPTEQAAGVLGQLRTTLDLPTGVESPVSIAVSWSLTDSAGEPITDDGTHYSAPGGLVGPEVSILLAPIIVPHGSPSDAIFYTLTATVTLRVGSESIEKILTIPLVVPQLGLPRLVAMFRYPNFAGIEDGFALIIVPPGSAIGSIANLTALLGSLRTALDSLRTFTNLVSLALGLGQLLDAIANQPVANVTVRPADPVPARAPSPPATIGEYYDIGDFSFRGWSVWRNALGAEDAVRSLIYLGPPGTGVRLHNDDQQEEQRAGTAAWEDDQGVFDLRAGIESFAVLRTLPIYSADPTVEGRAEPAGATAETVTPPGSRRDTYDITGFDNQISSLRFLDVEM